MITDKQKPPQCSGVCVRQRCAEIDEAARNRMELIVRSPAKRSGVTGKWWNFSHPSDILYLVKEQEKSRFEEVSI